MPKQNLRMANYFDVIEVKVREFHPHAYKPHFHSELSIGIIHSGETTLTIGNENYLFSKGDAIVIMPGVVHNCQPLDIDDWAFTMVYLNDPYREAFVKKLGEDMKLGFSRLDEEDFENIQKLSKTLQNNENDFTKEVEIIDCLNTIIDSIEFRIEKDTDQEMEAVRAYIDGHFLEDISLDQLEMIFELDKFKLIRHFKKLYNTTPSAYQLQCKVNHSKHLMKAEQNLLAAALESGFYDQAHFTREFKKATGMTPNFYMQSLQ